MSGERPGRRWAAAWSASALLHALLLALLWRLLPPTPPAARPGPAPFEVALVPAPPQPGLATPRGPGESTEPSAGTGRASPGTGRPGPPPGHEAARPGEAATGEGVRRWFAERGMGPALDLRPRLPRGAAPAAEEDAAQVADAALAARRAREIAGNARAADLARIPDESWTEERRRLADGFAPGTVAFDGVPGSGAPAVSGDWWDAAGRYARGGPPWPPAPDREPTARERVAYTAAAASIMPPETHAFFDAQAALSVRAAAAPARRITTLVAVAHDAEARVTGVRLLQTSGSVRHDREALAQARRIEGSIPAARFRSCVVHWAFVTELFVSPATPRAGFSFDANFRPVKADHPLGREARSRVELVAVHEG